MKGGVRLAMEGREGSSFCHFCGRSGRVGKLLAIESGILKKNSWKF